MITLIIASLKIGYIDAFIGLTTITIIHFFKNYSSKIVKFFGDISYSLYLFHPLIGGAFVNILSHTYRQPWQKPIIILIGVVITIISSYIVYRLVEKPTQTLSKKIKY